MIGRRVHSMVELEKPGDYFGPTKGWTGDSLACFFLLPAFKCDLEVMPGARSVHHVAFPPHTYRECPDGSLEIRQSIGADPFWHGYLDEGHVWRGVERWANT